MQNNMNALRETLWINIHDKDSPLEPKMEEKDFITVYSSENEILKRSDAFEIGAEINMDYYGLELVSILDKPVMITWNSLINFVNQKNELDKTL